jgi:hypothetical protein
VHRPTHRHAAGLVQERGDDAVGEAAIRRVADQVGPEGRPHRAFVGDHDDAERGRLSRAALCEVAGERGAHRLFGRARVGWIGGHGLAL